MKKGTKKGPGIWEISRGTYRVRVRGVDPRTGKLKEVDRNLTCNLKEARLLRETWRRDLKAGEVERCDRQTLGDYARFWLAQRAQLVRVGTLEAYTTALETVLPMIGDLYIDAITVRDMKACQSRMARELSHATINRRFGVAKMVLADACAEIGRPSPAERVKSLRERKTKSGLAPEQLRALLAAAERDRDYAFLLTLALTGMRWGEATALRWDDIDEDRMEIHVVRSQRNKVVSGTKSDEPRVYPLPETLLEQLREHRRMLIKDQHPGLVEGWVFATRCHRHCSRATLRMSGSMRKQFKKWCREAGIKRKVTPHDLRRTYVDLLRRAKVDAVVARSLVGHATESMRHVYSTVATEEQRDAMGRVLALVSAQNDEEGGGTGGGSDSARKECAVGEM